MKAAFSFGLAFFMLGVAGGALGYKLWADQEVQQPVVASRSIQTGLKKVSVPEQGLELQVRLTDEAARLTLDDNKTIIGLRVYDSWTGDASTAAAVDLVWDRQEKLFDQPSATVLDEFRSPNVPGLTIQETKDLTIDGRPALKQLYSSEVEVPGPFGSTSKQPLPNQLRYVIQDGKRFLILRAPGLRQTFLDEIAKNIRFVSAGGSTDEGLEIESEGSSLQLDALTPDQGDTGAIDISGESVQ